MQPLHTFKKMNKSIKSSEVTRAASAGVARTSSHLLCGSWYIQVLYLHLVSERKETQTGITFRIIFTLVTGNYLNLFKQWN